MSMPPPPPPPGSVPPPPPGMGGPPVYGGNPYGGLPASGPSYAGWGTRVGAYLVDIVVAIGFSLPGVVLGAVSDALGLLVQLIGAVAFIYVWSKMIGTTGQSWGKKALNIKVVDAQTGQFIGQGRAVGRYFAMILSAIPCYIGFLWPLWDQKKQTFHDKIVSTYVVTA